jgi:hypothetical protein
MKPIYTTLSRKDPDGREKPGYDELKELGANK